MENSRGIGFSLQKITIEQFAMVPENYQEQCNIRLVTKIKFGIDADARMIAAFTGFIFECDTKQFIILEGGCHFKIEEEAWSEMLINEGNTLKAPKGFLSHLAMLTVGTTRGILHTKTESTVFNRFVLPTINVAELIPKDLEFSLLASGK